MTELGELSLWIALLMAVWGAALSWSGAATGRDAFSASGARGVLAAAFFVALATAALGRALVTSDFSLRHVATFTSIGLPAAYKLSALWVGRTGALLLLAIVLAACATVALLTRRGRDLMVPWVAGTHGAALAVVLAMAATAANPFARLDLLPDDGRGLDPRLQTPAMVAWRPLLYLGFAAAATALALVIAARARRRPAPEWRGTLRAWLLGAWVALAGSVLLALWVGYAEPGSGGYWPWRSAANGGFSTGREVAGALFVAIALLVAGTRLGRRERRTASRVALVAGLVILAAGFAGATWQTEQEIALADGESRRTLDPSGQAWTFMSQGASRMERANSLVTAVALVAARAETRGRFITSERREYFDRHGHEQFAPYVTTGIRSSPLQDVAVRLVSVREGRATLRLRFVPLAAWIWVGGGIVVLGGLLALWPGARGSGAGA